MQQTNLIKMMNFHTFPTCFLFLKQVNSYSFPKDYIVGRQICCVALLSLCLHLRLRKYIIYFFYQSLKFIILLHLESAIHIVVYSLGHSGFLKILDLRKEMFRIKIFTFSELRNQCLFLPTKFYIIILVLLASLYYQTNLQEQKPQSLTIQMYITQIIDTILINNSDIDRLV